MLLFVAVRIVSIEEHNAPNPIRNPFDLIEKAEDQTAAATVARQIDNRFGRIEP